LEDRGAAVAGLETQDGALTARTAHCLHISRRPRDRKLTVGAKALAVLTIEKVVVKGGRWKVEAELGPVKYRA
jgi:hypothetical protein